VVNDRIMRFLILLFYFLFVHVSGSSVAVAKEAALQPWTWLGMLQSR
jgi:hypothetical protein